MPPAAAGGILFCLNPTVGQFVVTTIVVVVNIYTYNYYYVIGHSQVTLGFTSIVPLLQLPACGGSPQAVPAGERPLDLLDTPVRYNVCGIIWSSNCMRVR